MIPNFPHSIATKGFLTMEVYAEIIIKTKHIHKLISDQEVLTPSSSFLATLL